MDACRDKVFCYKAAGTGYCGGYRVQRDTELMVSLDSTMAICNLLQRDRCDHTQVGHRTAGRSHQRERRREAPRAWRRSSPALDGEDK